MIRDAEVVHDYVVHVSLEDGTAADLDFRYLLDYGGVFEPLRDPEYFRLLRADLDAGTIVWPNDADIAADTLYAAVQQRATGLS